MDISNKAHLYKIAKARDKRYDGLFYCAVVTTGIYCRPICPAKPKLENIIFYKSSAEAEKNGYRACLRCRPDLAPNSVQWSGTAAVVGRALKMISSGKLDEIGLDRFSDQLGVSSRHLRRLFNEHIGASPIEVAISQRLHLAKHLLSQSNLPITDISYASGYKSIRRFNESFKEKFHSPPSLVRRKMKSQEKTRSHFIQIELPVITPYDGAHIFNFFKNHEISGVETVINNTYQRGFVIENIPGAFEVSFDEQKSQLKARIATSQTLHLRQIIENIRNLFDTRVNPHSQVDTFRSKNSISQLYTNHLGLRIPGSWNSFETAICIILGQLVSVEQARQKVKKLVLEFGTEIKNSQFENCRYLFPEPKVLATANLKNIGLTKVRESAIRDLSLLVWHNQIDLSRSTDIAKTKAQLLAINGIGPWTVEMIAMRCLGDTNAFPKTDLIIKRALEHHQNTKGDWSPWNAYITLVLWKKYAQKLTKKNKKQLTTN